MAHFPVTTGVSLIKVKDVDGNVIRELSGNPVAASLVSKDLDFDARQSFKYVDVVVAEITDTIRAELVDAQLGYRDGLDDEMNWNLAQRLEESDRPLFTRNTARYHKIQISSNSVGVFWRLGALEFYGRTHGRRF